MSSNIQLAAIAIDEEHASRGGDGPVRDAAIVVVMRLQLREQQLLEVLAEALHREAVLADQLREVLSPSP